MPSWEVLLEQKLPDLEDWEKKYVEEVRDEIKILISEKEKILKNLENIKELSERYSAYWSLKEKFEQLQHKFKILQNWSHLNFKTEMDHYLCHEIYYFELCFSMLKEKYGAKDVDLRHFLNAAQLEYQYFFENKYDLASKKFYEKFESGKLGDDEDFIIWAGVYEMLNQNYKRLLELE